MVFLLAPAQGLRADVFYVDSIKGRFSAAFPDDWRVVNNQKPDDVLTVMAPGYPDYASCRVRVSEDKRFAIYPRHFADEIRNSEFAHQFWVDYVMQYKDAVIVGMNEQAGLGRGFASHAEATYTSVVGDDVHKHALVFVSHYANKVYVVECAAQEDYFVKWKPAFLSFVKSINFDVHGAQLPRGNYRDFTGDGSLKIYGPLNADAGRY